ncbi:MAG: 2-dehydropantoate 2-reductase [Spirochaetaceae bacterium]|nr:2-dehydropantoate 2-reductase [Spirochaetaceae bacterium]
MNIYVDFDDCLCETARYFSGLIAEMFGLDIPYEKIKYFNLQQSFSLSDEDYDKMMIQAHKPVVLLTYEETPGAVKTINSWIDKDYDVSIITGRPFSVYEASREWLDQHGLENVKLYCLNKYGRDNFIKGSSFNLELEDYYKMHFDYAVEDSPSAFKFFEHLPDLKVMVFDRPWNQDCKFPTPNYKRCSNWKMISDFICV